MKKTTKLLCLFAFIIVAISSTIGIVIASEINDLALNYTVAKTEYYVGEKVEIPTISAVYPDKVKDIIVSVKSPSGNIVDVNNNKFALNEVGEYKVYIVSIGSLDLKYFEYYSINTTIADFAVLTKEPYIPAMYISGTEYEVPSAEFIDFNVQNKSAVNYTVEYIDANGNSTVVTDKFTPSVSVNGSKITLKYTAKSSLQVDNVLTYEVPVNIAKEYIDNYPIYDFAKMFYNEGLGTLSNQSNCVELELSSPTKISFANKVNASFKFELISKQGYNSLDNVKAVITDSQDKDVSISLNIAKNSNNTSTLTVNGLNSYIINGSLNDLHDGLLVEFNNISTYIKDNSNAKICKITNCLNGSTFTGFPSKTVYISFEVLSVNTTSKLDIVQINNHYFSNDCYDMISPYVVLTEDLKTNYNDGEIVKLPIALAIDVVDTNSKSYVTVKKDNQIIKNINGVAINKLPANQAYEFIASIGKYTIQYTAQDESENEFLAGWYTVYVSDNVSPTLTINSVVKSAYVKGTQITIPEFTANDNNGAPTVLIYVVGPNMGYKVVNAGDSFTLSESGKYFIHYLAYDAYGNVASIDIMTESV